MKLSEIKAKPVVAISDARRVGAVADVLVDPMFRRLTALRIKSDGPGHDSIVAIENVRGIGPDAVTVPSPDVLLLPERAPHLGGFPSLYSAINSRLLSERGQVLGRISEVHFDPATRQVQSFEYMAGTIDTLLGRPRRVESADVISVGPGVVTVRVPAPVSPSGSSGEGAAPGESRPTDTTDRPGGGRAS